MRSMKFFLISIFTIISCDVCYACWGGWYTPKGYYMYRVSEITLEDEKTEKTTVREEWDGTDIIKYYTMF